MKVAACFGAAHQGSPAALMSSMTGAMRLFDHQSAEIRKVDGGALGYVAAGLPSPLGGWREREHQGNRLLIAGVPLPPSGSLGTLLDEAGASDPGRAAAVR